MRSIFVLVAVLSRLGAVSGLDDAMWASLLKPPQGGGPGESPTHPRAASRGVAEHLQEPVGHARLEAQAQHAALSRAAAEQAAGGKASAGKTAGGDAESPDNPQKTDIVDPVAEWQLLWKVRYFLPFLVVCVLAFESVHHRHAGINWDQAIPQPPQRMLDNSVSWESYMTGPVSWIRGFIAEPEGSQTRRHLFFALVADKIGGVYVSVLWTAWVGQWYNLLQHPHENLPAFKPLIVNFLILVVVQTVKDIYSGYLQSWFFLEWHTYMVTRFRNLWFARHAYYLMEMKSHGKDEVDNPDQRIAEDTIQFCDVTGSLLMGGAEAVMTLCVYIPMLWRLSPVSVFGLFKCPGWLVYAALFWAIGGTMLTRWIGQPLVSLQFASQSTKADYRFALAATRVNAESIAMIGGEAYQERHLSSQWGKVRRVTWEYMIFNKYYSSCLKLYSHTEFFLSLVILVPAYLLGEVTLGAMRQGEDALAQVRASFEFIIYSYGTIAAWRSAVMRLQAFEAETVNALCLARSSEEATRAVALDKALPRYGAQPEFGHQEVSAEGVQIFLPTGEMLLKVVDGVVIRPGDRVLITGPVGSGKSSFMRALSGIWPYLEVNEGGHIRLPPKRDCMFVPRVPSFGTCSLREMISYPERTAAYSRADVIGAVHAVGLSHLISQETNRTPAESAQPSDRSTAATATDENEQELLNDVERSGSLSAEEEALDAVRDWGKILSGGERQRAVAAQILLRRPRYVFLDEAVSSMGQEAGVGLYKLLFDRLGPDAAIVSISHDYAGMAPLHNVFFEVNTATKTLDKSS